MGIVRGGSYPSILPGVGVVRLTFATQLIVIPLNDLFIESVYKNKDLRRLYTKNIYHESLHPFLP